MGFGLIIITRGSMESIPSCVAAVVGDMLLRTGRGQDLYYFVCDFGGNYSGVRT